MACVAVKTTAGRRKEGRKVRAHHIVAATTPTAEILMSFGEGRGEGGREGARDNLRVRQGEKEEGGHVREREWDGGRVWEVLV